MEEILWLWGCFDSERGLLGTNLPLQVSITGETIFLLLGVDHNRVSSEGPCTSPVRTAVIVWQPFSAKWIH